jgi:uncharacterized membrane protein
MKIFNINDKSKKLLVNILIKKTFLMTFLHILRTYNTKDFLSDKFIGNLLTGIIGITFYIIVFSYFFPELK